MKVEDGLFVGTESDCDYGVRFVLDFVGGDRHVVVPEFGQQRTALRNYLSHQLIK